jgi:hypothetical protein
LHGRQWGYWNCWCWKILKLHRVSITWWVKSETWFWIYH